MQLPQPMTVALLQEDQSDKGLFRLRPLVDCTGPYQGDFIKDFPDTGYLRVVPDRNEQTTFKKRMRSIMPLCLIQMTQSPKENNKIRPNKNYAPSKKEYNKFVIYSDVIQPLPKDLIYEVIKLPGDAKGSAMLQELQGVEFLTPKAYIQKGMKWFGPFSSPPKRLQKEVEKPLFQSIYPVTLPDGTKHMLYWAKDARPAQKPNENNINNNEPERLINSPNNSPNPSEDNATDEKIEIGKPLEILDMNIDFDEQLKRIAKPLSDSANFLVDRKSPPIIRKAIEKQGTEDGDGNQAPITGTPLYAMPIEKDVRKAPSPARNLLHQVVEARLRAAKSDIDQALPQENIAPKSNNKIELNRQANAQKKIEKRKPDTPEQAPKLYNQAKSQKNSGNEMTEMLLKIARDELQSIEGERLALVMQLDRAKTDIEAFVNEKIEKAATANGQAIIKQQEELAAIKKDKDKLLSEIKALSDIWDEKSQEPLGQAALANTNAMLKGPLPVIIAQEPGEEIALGELAKQLEQTMRRAHFNFNRDDATAFILLLAMCPQMQIMHPQISEALRFVKGISKGLGMKHKLPIQKYEEQALLMGESRAYGSPALLATPFMQKGDLMDYMRPMLLSDTANTMAYMQDAGYQMAPWPIWTVFEENEMAQWPAPIEEDSNTVCYTAMAGYAATQSEIPKESLDYFMNLKEMLYNQGVTLSYELLYIIAKFMKTAAKELKGGIAAAMDYAVFIYIAPYALGSQSIKQAMEPMVRALPRTYRMLYNK